MPEFLIVVIALFFGGFAIAVEVFQELSNGYFYGLILI